VRTIENPAADPQAARTEEGIFSSEFVSLYQRLERKRL
jgi:hypothetical protein